MGECTSNSTIRFLRGIGVELTTTCPYTPEQHIIIEWICHIIGKSSIAMLLTANLSEAYWEEARSTDCYLYNRSPGEHTDTHSTFPYEQYYGVQPHVLHFKIFSSRCYPTVLNWPKENRSSKALVGVFVGHQSRKPRRWRIYLPYEEEFIITAHAHYKNEKYSKQEVLSD